MFLPMSDPIYLDHNATTRPSADVVDSIVEWAGHWGNPSSIHRVSREPKRIMREAHISMAKNVGAISPLEIIFTSGGSEANNLAIKGFFSAIKNKAQFLGKNEFITTAVEHPCIIKQAQFLKDTWGIKVHFIPVNKAGEIDLEFYKNCLSEKTALVSIMFANNETGHIFPIKKMVEMAHEHKAYFHCDAVQTFGKVKFNVKDYNVDMASFSGHKFYALKGAGALYCKGQTPLDPLINGGGQERGRRAGTENTMAIASMSLMSQSSLVAEPPQLVKELRDYFEVEVEKQISNVEITGKGNLRLPNTSHLIIKNIDGETLLINLDVEGFAVSTGAACSSGNPEPSPVLLAMGFSKEEAQSSLRVSLGWKTTKEEIDNFLKALVKVVKRQRELF